MADTTTATAAVAPAPTLVSADSTTPAPAASTSPAETITTSVPEATPAQKSIKTEGTSNGLPPQAPGVQLDPPDAVIRLREWVHEFLHNSIHSQDTAHYNTIIQHVEAIVAMLHNKISSTKES